LLVSCKNRYFSKSQFEGEEGGGEALFFDSYFSFQRSECRPSAANQRAASWERRPASEGRPSAAPTSPSTTLYRTGRLPSASSRHPAALFVGRLPAAHLPPTVFSAKAAAATDDRRTAVSSPRNGGMNC